MATCHPPSTAPTTIPSGMNTSLTTTVLLPVPLLAILLQNPRAGEVLEAITYQPPPPDCCDPAAYRAGVARLNRLRVQLLAGDMAAFQKAIETALDGLE